LKEAGCANETNINANGTAWSKPHHCLASAIHCAIQSISASREKLGVLYAWNHCWLLAERQGVMVLDLFCGCGTVLLVLLIFKDSLNCTCGRELVIVFFPLAAKHARTHSDDFLLFTSINV
jgi:hypothetical protein